MKVRAFEIYFFRLTQILAFALTPLAYLLLFLIMLLTGVVFAAIFLILGILVSPLMFALMMLDMASDFSRSRYTDHFGKYIDIFLFFPDILWNSFRFIIRQGNKGANALWSYARE